MTTPEISKDAAQKTRLRARGLAPRPEHRPQTTAQKRGADEQRQRRQREVIAERLRSCDCESDAKREKTPQHEQQHEPTGRARVRDDRRCGRRHRSTTSEPQRRQANLKKRQRRHGAAPNASASTSAHFETFFRRRPLHMGARGATHMRRKACSPFQKPNVHSITARCSRTPSWTAAGRRRTPRPARRCTHGRRPTRSR